MVLNYTTVASFSLTIATHRLREGAGQYYVTQHVFLRNSYGKAESCHLLRELPGASRHVWLVSHPSWANQGLQWLREIWLMPLCSPCNVDPLSMQKCQAKGSSCCGPVCPTGNKVGSAVEQRGCSESHPAGALWQLNAASQQFLGTCLQVEQMKPWFIQPCWS